jgi:hypothetical protein
MNIARLFSAYRILERQLAKEKVRHRVEVSRLHREITELKAERLEWVNRVLKTANVQPIPSPHVINVPKPPVTPVDRPPVGITAKREYMARQQNESIPTAEQVLKVS